MRRFPTAFALTAVVAASLVACAPAPGTASAGGCTPASTAASALDAAHIDGGFGTPVAIKPAANTKVSDYERKVTVAGSGAQITSTAQIITAHFTAVDSGTGTALFSSTNGNATGSALPVSAFNELAKNAGEQLICARAGSRVEIALPAKDIAPAVSQQLGAASSGIILVVDVKDVALSHAQGSSVYNSVTGMPSVVRTPEGRPGIVFPSAKAPAKKETITLIRGEGKKLTGSDTALVQFMAAGWDDRKVFYSSWDQQAVTLPLAAPLPTGFKEALEGATVGSQIMVVLPESEVSAQDRSMLSAPPSGAVVYVFDVLGTSSALQ